MSTGPPPLYLRPGRPKTHLLRSQHGFYRRDENTDNTFKHIHIVIVDEMILREMQFKIEGIGKLIY